MISALLAYELDKRLGAPSGAALVTTATLALTHGYVRRGRLYAVAPVEVWCGILRVGRDRYRTTMSGLLRQGLVADAQIRLSARGPMRAWRLTQSGFSQFQDLSYPLISGGTAAVNTCANDPYPLISGGTQITLVGCPTMNTLLVLSLSERSERKTVCALTRAQRPQAASEPGKQEGAPMDSPAVIGGKTPVSPPLKLMKFEMLWKTTHGEVYPDEFVGAFTAKERGQARQIIEKCPADELVPLIEAALRRWDAVASHIGKTLGYKKVPSRPVVGFLLQGLNAAVTWAREEQKAMISDDWEEWKP